MSGLRVRGDERPGTKRYGVGTFGGYSGSIEVLFRVFPLKVEPWGLTPFCRYSQSPIPQEFVQPFSRGTIDPTRILEGGREVD